MLENSTFLNVVFISCFGAVLATTFFFVFPLLTTSTLAV
jgi:hypothetical protein